MDFRFTDEIKVSQIDEAVSFMMGPRLWVPQTDYPDFLDWADKVYKELKKEKKRALLCIKENEVVGVTIYQKHQTVPGALEIKNLTVRPDLRGRYIASFLLRNTEIEGGRNFRCDKVVCDAKAKNYPVLQFLATSHYKMVSRTKLYSVSDQEDIVFTKALEGARAWS